MPAARQLCRMSNTIATAAGEHAKCPWCGGKVTPTQTIEVHGEGRSERRQIIPAHIRNEHGEMRVRMDRDKDRYPKPGTVAR